MQQSFLEAGYAPVTLTVEGLDAYGQVELAQANLTQTINPVVTQIKTYTYTLERTDLLGTITDNGKVNCYLGPSGVTELVNFECVANMSGIAVQKTSNISALPPMGQVPLLGLQCL